MDEHLKDLLKRAKDHWDSMTPGEQAYQTMLQRRSWVTGEMMLEHPEMTKEAALALYEKLPEGWGLAEIERLRGRQAAAWKWAQHVFGPEVASDKLLRALRFMEEAAELTQVIGLIREDAHRMIDVVYDRAPGEARQEVGGVMLTLMVLSTCCAVTADAALADEQERVWLPAMIEKIRGRQATKPQPTRTPPPPEPSDAIKKNG